MQSEDSIQSGSRLKQRINSVLERYWVKPLKIKDKLNLTKNISKNSDFRKDNWCRISRKNVHGCVKCSAFGICESCLINLCFEMLTLTGATIIKSGAPMHRFLLLNLLFCLRSVITVCFLECCDFVDNTENNLKALTDCFFREAFRHISECVIVICQCRVLSGKCN